LDDDPTPASDSAPSDASGAASGEDVVLLGQELPDGKSVGVVRLREGQVELGRVQPLEEGKPVLGEVVKLTPRANAPRVCDVDVQYSPRPSAPRVASAAPRRELGGPPQVATDEYRKNWDVIWARGKKPAQPS
jgi:hypothetical protein